MGYYKREDIPFQFALAEAFTICDAHHCSIASGTDPNRIIFWSGSNFNPTLRARGENCTDADSEPNNLRCWIKGALPTPGYTYQGSAFKWPTIPDVLEKAGISWRFYQDPNDNWTGAMHGCLAFESFRTAPKDSPLYLKGMSHWSLEQFAQDVKSGNLPQVCWILPPANWSEHPSASSPIQGAEFTSRVLDALSANPDVWSRTAFFLTFDENDGLFDHMPPPAVPSYHLDGTLAGKSTVDVRGHYFSDTAGKYIDPADTISGKVRPWGLGPRVPLYVISPWSRGGWVNSQVFDHTSVGQFIEKRFGVVIPGISPWHRAINGDLTSAFDFVNPNNPTFPKLPDVTGSTDIIAKHRQRPKPNPPTEPAGLFQEPGVRPSRALPYELHVNARVTSDIELTFSNTGKQGAVFHVYDRLHLDRIPRRYTVEAGKTLTDTWNLESDNGSYRLSVHGPNGFLREFTQATKRTTAEIEVTYVPTTRELLLTVHNSGSVSCRAEIRSNAYRHDGPWKISVAANQQKKQRWSLADSGNWYDFTVAIEGAEGYTRRFAGRVETGTHSISDPAMASTE